MTNFCSTAVGDITASDAAFWDLAPSRPATFVAEEESAEPVYDLGERTERFGEQIVRFAKQIPRDPANDRLIGQLVGAGTSVGANYCEADDGVSRADFKHRIGQCRKEARETKFFLRMVAVAEPRLKDQARTLWIEAHSLHLIFSRIWRSTRL